MLERRHSRSSRPDTTGGVADPEQSMRATCRLVGQHTRAATNPDTAELAKQHSNHEETLNKLADHVASLEGQPRADMWKIRSNR